MRFRKYHPTRNITDLKAKENSKKLLMPTKCLKRSKRKIMHDLSGTIFLHTQEAIVEVK
jgi:hypothetical protein